MELEVEKLDTIINRYGAVRSHILGIFQDIQREYRYLSKDAIRHVCDRLDMPFSKGYEVATFYKALSLKPRGAHTIHVCLGTACHLRGGPNIVDTFERELRIRIGDTTENGIFTLESVNCLGACALAPLVRVNEQDFGKSTPSAVRKIIDKFANGE
jgi:NADH:ubiquinone oxidoreductase subunit E